MPSEEMVFTKRTIFPFLIKVRPSLRDSAFSLRFPVENFRMVKFSTGKTLRKRRDEREGDSEGENCDRRSACATRKRTIREPLFMPYPGMKPLSSRLRIFTGVFRQCIYHEKRQSRIRFHNGGSRLYGQSLLFHLESLTPFYQYIEKGI